MTTEDNILDIEHLNKDPRKKRRSKNDEEGRGYRCKHCEKTYLSEIALNNHIKTKHAHLVEIVNRGRGRPRKNNINGSPVKQSSEIRFKNFFEGSLRKKEINSDAIEPIHASIENFDNIWTKYKDKL